MKSWLHWTKLLMWGGLYSLFTFSSYKIWKCQRKYAKHSILFIVSLELSLAYSFMFLLNYISSCLSSQYIQKFIFLLNHLFQCIYYSPLFPFQIFWDTYLQNEVYLILCYITELQQIKATKDWPCKSGSIQYTLRFDPVVSKTSGLFIVKIAKVAP